MISANELRVDNWVQSNLTKGFLQVDWLVIKHVCDGNIQNAYDNSHVYLPIALTSDLLIKMGFALKKDSEISWCELTVPSKNGIVVFYEGDKNGICDVVIEIEPGFRLKHVHEIQNWYYLISNGKEIEFTL